MFERILLAVDRSGRAGHAEPPVAALARRSGGQVLVVSVRDASADTEPDDEAARRVDGAVRRLGRAGVAARGVVRPARELPAAEQIVDAARELEPDLVALGSRGRGSLEGLVLGSTDREVAGELRCPVLVVRGEPCEEGVPEEVSALRRVLVAVDDSERSRAAAEAAGDLAREHEAALLVLHVREEGDDEPPADGLLRATPAGWPARLREVRVAGPVAGEIARAAGEWSADVIVLGSRRPTGLGGLLVGSVAWDVVRLTQRPVLLA